jgi:hypothetical protein
LAVTTIAIPQADPGRSYRALAVEIDEALARVLRRGRYVLGEEVESFEREFAGWIGARFAVGVGSGTDALATAKGLLLARIDTAVLERDAGDAVELRLDLRPWIASTTSRSRSIRSAGRRYQAVRDNPTARHARRIGSSCSFTRISVTWCFADGSTVFVAARH